MNRKDRRKHKKEYAEDISGFIYHRLLNLALSRFEYDNLPTGLTTRIIEKQLITHGMVMFFKDNDGVLKCLSCSGTGTFNIYNEPIQYMVYGLGLTKHIKVDKGIIIRNNPVACEEDNMLWYYAQRLNEIEQTKDVNLNAQKTPFILYGTEQQQTTLRTIMHQVRKFKYAIFGEKSLASNPPEVLQTKADFLLDKLQDDKNATMNEVLTYLGINNANTDKKERLLTDEVNANNEYINISIDLMFEEREKAVKLINEKFGTTIVVRKRETEEVKDNGTIHNND